MRLRPPPLSWARIRCAALVAPPRDMGGTTFMECVVRAVAVWSDTTCLYSCNYLRGKLKCLHSATMPFISVCAMLSMRCLVAGFLAVAGETARLLQSVAASTFSPSLRRRHRRDCKGSAAQLTPPGRKSRPLRSRAQKCPTLAIATQGCVDPQAPRIVCVRASTT